MLIHANAIGAIQVTSKSDNEDLPSISKNERKNYETKNFK